MYRSQLPLTFIWTLFAIVLLTISCEEGEPVMGPEQLLVTIKANYYPTCRVYPKVVITDSHDRILAVKEVTGQMDTPIIAPASAMEETINLFIVVYEDDSHYRVSGYRGIKKGSEFMGHVPQETSNIGHNIQISTANAPAFDNLTFSAASEGFAFIYMPTISNNVRLPASTTKVFVQLVSNGEGRYGFVDVPFESEDMLLDYSHLNRVSEKRHVDMGQDLSGVYLTINGAFSDNASFMDSYTLYGGPLNLDTYVPNEFARYFTKVNYEIGKVQYTETRSETRPTFKYEPMKLQVDVKNADPENFNLRIGGEYTYYEVQYSNLSSNIELIMFGRQGDTNFTIPDFSQIEGLKRFPYHALRRYGIKVHRLKSQREDQSYFKYFSTVPDVEPTYDQQIVALGGLL